MLTWEVDRRGRRRRPITLLYLAGMWSKRDKEAFEGERRTLRTARRLQRAGDAPPTRATRLLADVRRSDLAGMTAWTVRPRLAQPALRVVYLHGGGFVHPLTRDYWRLVRALARTPAEVVVPAYPLAPGATAQDVLPRLEELVLDEDARGVPTVLMGDSAGGAMALSIARRIVDGDGAGLAGIVCLSPWLDARLAEGGVEELETSDPMLAESGLRAAGRWWAGDAGADHPLVSPVHMDLDGLPPIDIFTGDRDILRPAVDLLADRARLSGTQVTVHEWPRMFHVWMTRAIPEARQTRRRLVRLLADRGRGARLAPSLTPTGRT